MLLPLLLDGCHPSGRVNRAARRRTRQLCLLRPEAKMQDLVLPEKRKVGSSTLPLTTSFGPVSSALTSANAYWALSRLRPSSDHDCPCVTVVSRSLSHADRTPRLRAPVSGPLRPELAELSGCGPWSPPLPPIGLTGAALFVGGEVSRADSRVRSPGSFTCARCPAVRSALDAVPEAYHNPAAVWWGAFAASTCMLTALSPACTISFGDRCRPRSVASALACTVRGIDVALNTWYCGQVGYGHRGVSCGWTRCPAPGHCAVARRG
jgi:hypothetical protein